MSLQSARYWKIFQPEILLSGESSQLTDWIVVAFIIVIHYTNVSTMLLSGTIVAMETKPGVLKPAHRAIIEAMRDSIERDLHKHREESGCIW